MVVIVAHLRICEQRLDFLVDSGEGWDGDRGDSEHGSSGETLSRAVREWKDWGRGLGLCRRRDLSCGMTGKVDSWAERHNGTRV